LKKEEVCARKIIWTGEFLRSKISCVMYLRHLWPYQWEFPHNWTSASMTTRRLLGSRWSLMMAFPLRHGKAEACWWHLWHLHNLRYEIRFFGEETEPY
jgi:hypothetical protein